MGVPVVAAHTRKQETQSWSCHNRNTEDTDTDRTGPDQTLDDSLLRGRDGSESLLTRRVPDLQLDPLALDVHRPDLEVHTDGGDVAACQRRRSLVSSTLGEHLKTQLTASKHNTESSLTLHRLHNITVAGESNGNSVRSLLEN